RSARPLSQRTAPATTNHAVACETGWSRWLSGHRGDSGKPFQTKQTFLFPHWAAAEAHPQRGSWFVARKHIGRSSRARNRNDHVWLAGKRQTGPAEYVHKAQHRLPGIAAEISCAGITSTIAGAVLIPSHRRWQQA